MLQQAHDDLDNLYASTEQLGNDLRTQNEEVENLRVTVSMLEGAHQQIQGQITVLRGAVDNNLENIRRNEEDLQGQQDRSSGIAAQMEQAQQRICQIDETLTRKDADLNELQR